MKHHFTRFILPFLAIVSIALPATASQPSAELENQIKQYILAHPEVIVESLENYQQHIQNKATEQRTEALKSSQKELYQDTDSLVLGNPKGSINMSVFLDHRCGFCRKNWPVVLELLEKNKDVRLSVKEYPVLGEESVAITRLVLASPADKKADYFLALMKAEGGMTKDKALQIAKDMKMDTELLSKNADAASISAMIAKTESLAEKLYLTGTPMYTIQDQLIEGGKTLEAFEDIIKKLKTKE